MKKTNWIYPCQKLAKTFWLPRYQNVQQQIHIANIRRFFTVQTTLSMWITINDVNQHELDKTTAILKKRIKDKIRNTGLAFFKKESIVDVHTGKITRRNYQYLTVEITHFVTTGMIYDKENVVAITQPFYLDVIDNELMRIEEWTIIKKKNEKNNSEEYLVI